MDEAERVFEALSVRSRQDDEEATKVRWERDELLQKDVKTLLAKAERELELRLGVKEKLVALEQRAS